VFRATFKAGFNCRHEIEEKVALVGSDSIVDAPAAQAVFAGVTGIGIAHRPASQSRRIGINVVVERPVVQPCALSVTVLKPVADVGQIFQPNRACSAVRGLIGDPRNYVVVEGLNPPLSSRKLAQPSLGSLGAAALKTRGPMRMIGAVIIGPHRDAAEAALRLPVGFVGIGHLGNAAHDHLSREAKHVARVAVGQLAQIEPPEFLHLTCLGREKVAGLIATLKRIAEHLLLLSRRLQLDAFLSPAEGRGFQCGGH
jgi:hypothetical protein